MVLQAWGRIEGTVRLGTMRQRVSPSVSSGCKTPPGCDWTTRKSSKCPSPTNAAVCVRFVAVGQLSLSLQGAFVKGSRRPPPFKVLGQARGLQVCPAETQSHHAGRHGRPVVGKLVGRRAGEMNGPVAPGDWAPLHRGN